MCENCLRIRIRLSAGGYFVWIWLRDDKPVGWAFLGSLLLLLYGVIPTLQPAHFGRVYAAYGGVFIVMALLWGGRSTASNPTGSI